MYEFVDAAVLRAAIHRSDMDIPPWPDLSGSTPEHVAGWVQWLRQVWSHRELAAAMEWASPALAARIRVINAGTAQQPRQVRAAVLSTIRYLLRAAGRATPFGVFAGVSPLRVGENVVARFGDEHRVARRVDAVWLAEVLAQLESTPQVRRRLPVVANNLAFVRDGRLVLGCQQQLSTLGESEPVEVSVRHTSAVQAIMRWSDVPIRVEDLEARLSASFPDAPMSVIEQTVASLVAQRFLITSLRPPMTSPEPLQHVVTALGAAEGLAVPEAASLVRQLCDLRDQLADRGTLLMARRDDVSAAPVDPSTVPSTPPRSISVDVVLDATVVMAPMVVREAQRAAAALVRLCAHPTGSDTWRDYHHRFCERYGIGALVPLRQLLYSATGLGFPAGYRDSSAAMSRPAMSERDTHLLAIAQHAAITHQIEVALDDAAITKMSTVDAGVVVQPHTELRVRVHAVSCAALQRGEFELVVVGVSRAAGVTAGRFLDLFGGDDRNRMRAAYSALPTVAGNAIPAQLSCPPAYVRTENVARTPLMLPRVVSLAEHSAAGHDAPSLEDLVVSADRQRLYVISLSTRRPVEGMALHAVELTNHAHPVLRFLSEISTALAVPCEPFSWGAASQLPFLPRIRVGRSILSPARWRVSAGDLPGATAGWHEWAGRFQQWRRRYRLPAAVYLGDNDRRLRLDLDIQAHLSVLRDTVDHAGYASLREAPQPGVCAWIQDRAHELVLPMARTALPVTPSVWSGTAVSEEHGHLPGASNWLYVKIPMPAQRHHEILRAVPELMSMWDTPVQWWFLPYQDPAPHLRLRIRLEDPDGVGPAATRVGVWAAALRRRGLVGQLQWDTYYPETGRYGHGSAITAAEAVFAADSLAVLAQLSAGAHPSGPPLQALTAASLVDLAITASANTAMGMRWLIDHADTSPRLPRPLYQAAVTLADPTNKWARLREIPSGAEILQAWARRRSMLSIYHTSLAESGRCVQDVLPDLLHLHHVRMAGIAPDAERQCLHLARAAALSWTARYPAAS